jgi:hypothetical protein
MNEAGSFHIAAGVGFGFHGTIYQQTTSLLGASFSEEEEDGAVTITVPIDVQFGITKPLSLGLYVEPGAYLDSNATRTNALVIAGVKPQLYLVQSEDFGWFMNARAGYTFLNISDNDDSLQRIETRYSGPQFGLGTGIGAYFGRIVGLNVGLNWLRSSFDLQELTIDNTTQSLESFEAELETTGIELTAQLAFRF